MTSRSPVVNSVWNAARMLSKGFRGRSLHTTKSFFPSNTRDLDIWYK